MANSIKVHCNVNGSNDDGYLTILAGSNSSTTDVIQLALQQMHIYEDPSFYDLQESFTTEVSNPGRILSKSEQPVSLYQKWAERKWRGEMMFRLRKQSLNRTDLAMQRLMDNLSPDVEDHLTDDMCNLSELSESSMLATLRTRFVHNKIYTYVGSILIAVNPYFFYPIYNPNYREVYQSGKLGDHPPHIFAVANDAYHSMLSDKEDQAVIISGESGAGKTESTKFLLHHLMNLSAKFEEEKTLELITLGTGPVLEAFGNARTLSNNNSSRFGKFIVVRFRENGAYYSASIQQYLLEKSRIVLQAEHERNYHVFYYLLSGGGKALKGDLSLQTTEDYHYLTHGSVPLKDVNESYEFHRLQRSLTMLGISDATQKSLFSILAAILHLGNIKYKEDSNDTCCQIDTPSILHCVASLLKVDESTLKQALTTRKSKAGGSHFVVQYKLNDAADTRDAMAKALYGALFDWIVAQVNVALVGSRSRHRHRGHIIGVLDIFGFEVYDENSFEQFCINYANEQLQQYFNKHVFKSEQEEYVRESIRWDAVSYIDNSDCLDLIARKPTGLLHLLDEECSFPGANDNSLFDKFECQHKKHTHYKSPPVKQEDPCFLIVHYAGDVLYRVKGFREKNRDRMHKDIVEVLKTSRSDLVRALIGLPSLAVRHWSKIRVLILATAIFRHEGKQAKVKESKKKSTSLGRIISAGALSDRPNPMSPRKPETLEKKFSVPVMLTRPARSFANTHTKRQTRHGLSNSLACRGPALTVSAQFNLSLVSLMETLEKAKPYFVRCIKSNNDKQARQFDDDVILRQLRYTGMLQTIKIRKSGYSVRIGFDVFYEKYHFLMGPKQDNIKEQIRSCLEAWGFSLSSNDVQIGQTKVFMREEHKQLLQDRLQAEVLDRIVMLQKWFRGNLARCRFLALRRSTIVIQAYVRGWLARLRYNELRRQVSAAVVLQAWWRGISDRRKFRKVVRNTILIQSWWRGYKQRKLYRKIQEDRAAMDVESQKHVLEQPPAEKVTTIVDTALVKGSPPHSTSDKPAVSEEQTQQGKILVQQQFSRKKSPVRKGPISRSSIYASDSSTSLISTSGEVSSAGSSPHSSPHRHQIRQDVSESGQSPLHRRAAIQDKKGVRLRMKVSPTSSSTDVSKSKERMLSSSELKQVKEDLTGGVQGEDRMYLSSLSSSGSTVETSETQTQREPQRLSPNEIPTAASTQSQSSLSAMDVGSKKVKRHGSKLRRSRPPKKSNAIGTHFFHTHMFKRGQKCSICGKVFSGFLKQGLKCEACQTSVHHHCVNRVHVCSAHIQEGHRLTFSAKKILSSVSDLDDFDGFLMEKIGSMKSEEGGSIDGSFKLALVQFHTAIVSNLSLKLQPVTDVEGSTQSPPAHSDEVSATFDQLTLQFTAIMKGLAKSNGLHDSHMQVVVLQFKGFLDEFSNTRRNRDIKRRYSQVPKIKVKTKQKASLVDKKKETIEHKGHTFVIQTFNVLTICEFCENQMPVLSQGVVCSVCSYTCHESCLKRVKDKCKAKQQQELKTIDEDEAMKIQTLKLKTQFGVSLKKLVPGKVVRVPVVLERLMEHIEANGLHAQGIYRKTPSPSNKASLKAALDRDPLDTCLTSFQINSSAALVKNFLQSLPHPLMTFELYREFMLSTELSDPSQQLRTIHQLIARLPEVNHCILERLLFHLARVAKNQDSNLMDPHNLAIVFAPCLFRSKKDPKPQDMVKELTKAQKVLEVIISEQLDRLNANLQNITKFSSAASTAANQLQELIECEGQDPSSAVKQHYTVSKTESSPSRPSSTIEQLAVELEFLERERAEWTAQLPRLKPFKTSFPSLEDLSQSPSDEDHPGTPSSLTSLESESPGTSQSESFTKLTTAKQRAAP